MEGAPRFHYAATISYFNSIDWIGNIIMEGHKFRWARNVRVRGPPRHELQSYSSAAFSKDCYLVPLGMYC